MSTPYRCITKYLRILAPPYTHPHLFSAKVPKILCNPSPGIISWVFEFIPDHCSSSELPALEHHKLWCLQTLCWFPGERSLPIGLRVSWKDFTFFRNFFEPIWLCHMWLFLHQSVIYYQVSFEWHSWCGPGFTLLFLFSVKCPRGTYRDGTSCTKCDIGFYSTGEDVIQCSACPNGYLTFQEGATSGTMCFSNY